MSSSADLILVLNAGSSSIKYAVFRQAERVLSGQRERLAGGGHRAAIRELLEELPSHFPGKAVAAVGHRVVHGGNRYTAPVVVTATVLADLEQLIPLAPLHEPHNLEGIQAVAAVWPNIPQVACFDTAFHATMPAVEHRLALPRRYHDSGIKRYGFHGLAYQSVLSQLRRLDPELSLRRIIACHLGNGASLCAIHHGQSIATTMSFTPLDGLVMGTRPGHLDPGVILFLLRNTGLTLDQLETVLHRESGLLGVSGISGDMRDLLASSEPAAVEAVELFCYRVVREIGAMAAALQGVEGITFSGGIGEHAAVVRERILRALSWLGVTFDPEANRSHAQKLHAEGSRVAVYRLATDEEAVISAQVRAVLGMSED